MVQVSLSTSTNFDGDLNALVEDQGTALTFQFDLDEPAPAGGLKVYIDSDIEQILNRLDLPGAIANPRFENLNLFATQTNLDNSGLAVEITEGSTFATLTLDIFDNPEPDTFLPETFDGLVEAVFSLVTADQIAPEDQPAITGVSDYTIDPDAGSSTVLFADDISQLPSAPPPSNDYDEAVSGDISDDPNNPLNLPLAEGTTRLSATTGGGEQEYVTVTVPDGFQLDSLVLESFTPNDVAFIGVQEGTIFTEPLDNSAELSEFLGYTLFGPSAVDTDILDNIGNGSNGPGFGGQGFEGPLPAGTYTFALQQLGADSDYTLAFNVTEVPTIQPMPPVATDDTYSTVINDPLVIDVAAGVLSNDTDINNDDLTAEVLSSPSNGTLEFNADGSFSYTPNTDFTGSDSFSYSVSDGNGGSDTADVSISVIDNVGPPVVSFEAIPGAVSEEDPLPSTELTFTVTGEFPEGGILVNFDTLGDNDIIAFTEQFAASPEAEFNNIDLTEFDPATGRIGWTLLAPEASVKVFFLNDLIEEGTQTFDFRLVEGDGYTVDPDQSATLFTLSDDNGGPGVGPTVGVSVSETDLAEGDTFTVTFNVAGDIPAEGVEVLVQSDVPGSLGQFDLADLGNITTTGIAGLPEVGDGGGGSFFVTITEPTATITLNVFDDILAEDPLDITFTVANGEEYEVAPDAASTTLTISDEVQPVGPTVGLSVDQTTLIEGGDPVTLTISVDGEIPAEGLQILINDTNSVQNQIRSLTEFDVGNITTTGIDGFPTPAEGDSGFFVTVTEPTATITLAAFDEGVDEDEAAENFTFELIDGEAYEVDANAGSITVNIVDSAPVEPTVSFSTDITTLTESEGSIVTFSFEVDGAIPEGGLPISLQIDADQFDWFFDFDNNSRPRTNAETGSFDSVLILGDNSTGIGGGRLIGTLLPPDFNVLELVITENAASFQFEIFDDVFAEANEDITITLLSGDGYEVEEGSTPVTLTLQDSPDGIIDGTSPVVGLSVDSTTVAEGEALTVTFTVTGDIPAEGLPVFVDSNSSGVLGEFNPDEVSFTGLAAPPGPDTDAGGFVAVISESTATITLPVFKDGLGEGTETYTFNIVDGEAYDPDPAASEVTLTIEETPPVISVDVVGGVFEGSDLLIPNLVESPAAGTPVLSVIVQSDAPIPEKGLVVNINTDLADLTEFFEGSNFVPTSFGGEVLSAIYDADGNATGLQVRMDAFNTVINFADGLGLEAAGPHEVSFSVEAGENYIASTDSASITVYDTDDQVPAPTSTPEIAINIAEQRRPLSEGSGAITLEFTVTGEIPEEGVIAYVSTGERAGLGDFDLLNAGVVGGSFPPPDGNAGGFYFKITEPTASITLQAAVDEAVEGIEDINVALAPLPGYTIADGAGEATALLRDSRNSEIQVSLAGSPEVLVEEDCTLAVHTFELSAPPPEGGITVTVIADAAQGLADFDLSGVETTGITGEVEIAESFPEQLTFTITEQTATISLPVANDGAAEGIETVSLTLAEPGEDANYQVDPVTNTAAFTIVDTADEVPPEPITDGRLDSIGDTIATATAIGLTADNSNVTIEASINGNFFNLDNPLTDNTEDVDMYSVDLSTGDVLRLDIDARITRSSDEAPDTVVQIFDADGNLLAQSDDDFAPDELFAPGRQDSYLEFTPDADGTYYVGVSSFGNGLFDFWTNDDGTFDNDFYDPNVAGSGAGRSDGAYTLNLSLNEEASAAATEIPASTGEGPTVSLFASPATYNDDDSLAASSLVQFLEDGASILTLSLDTDGEIPEEGIEVYLTSNIDLSTVFSTRAPFTPIGAEVQGAVFDDAGVPVGVKVKLTGNAAVFNLNIDNADEAPTDGVQDITFTLEPAAGYQVGSDSTFTTSVYDTLADVPAAPAVPTVGIEVSETTLVESEGNRTTLTFTLDSPPPAEGVLVNVDSGVRAALGEFDVFNAEVVGGDFPSPNFRASGFFFRITEQTATITLAAFDETTNPEIPAEDALEGVDEFTFALQPGAGYAISPSANAVTVTIADNPDSVVLPDGGDNSDSSDGGLTESEFNDTIADAMATGFSTTNPFFEITGEIDNSRQTRNFVDATEDVDMYAFDLEAGQTIILDVDAGGTGSAGVEGSLLDNILRVFDAEGNEVAINENGGARDEVFQANGDAYLEFEAPETGTYYVGISNLGNNFYDPNEQASGSGWIFDGRFEPGPYRFTATLKGAVVSDNDSVSGNDDTIATAQTLDLSAENPNILVQAAFEQRFEDRSNTADATEDVDLFKVELTAGDVIAVDADSVLVDFDGFPSGPAPDITIFDANGERVVLGTDEDGEPIFAYSRQDGAPDEAFVAGRDGYIEFTAPETGTYYIGASQYRNNSYDANVVGSGSGAVFSPRFGVLAGGEYTLNIALNPEGFNGEVYEEFDGTPAEGVPVVSFTTSAGTFGSGDVVISSQLIESEPGTVGILDFTFNVEGDIPEGGLEVLVKSDTDFSTYFEGLSANPRVAVGGELIGGLYDSEGGLIGFRALLTANNARFPYNANSDRDDDPTAPETVTFSLANSPDYVASETASSSAVTFYDDLAQVQAGGGPVPEVGISVDQTQFIESEGTEVTLTVNATGDIPADGLLVYIDSGVRGFLGEFDVFNAEVNGGTFPSPNGAASGFFFRVFENTATIKLQVFNETTNDQIPPEDALEGVENFTVTLQPTDAYTVAAAAAAVDITILDNPDSVPLPPDGGNGGGNGGGETDGPVTDNDSRNTIDDTIETAVATGLSSDNPNVTVEGSIAVRWRNAPEQRADNTEDVDMFSFELAAGETVTIDADSVPFELNGVTQTTGVDLRLFNAAGEELASSQAGAGPGEVVPAVFPLPVELDGFLEFTATEAGVYYVGVSQAYNDNYDPNVNTSGDGVQLVDQGLSPGPYTLDLTLKSEQQSLPVVSFDISPEVVAEDSDNPSFVFTITVDGEIPEEGITTVWGGSFLTAPPRLYDDNIPVPFLPDGSVEFGGPIFDEDGNLTGFTATLFEPVITANPFIFNDIIEEEPLDLVFSLLPGEGYIVGQGDAPVTIIDGDSVIPGSGPTVSLSVDNIELEEGDEFTVSFAVDGEISEGGLQVFVDGPAASLSEFNIFGDDGIDPVTDIVGLAGFPEPDNDAGGFFAILTENQASITLSVFDDGPTEGPETLTFELLNGEQYEVGAEASAVTLTINDFETVGADADDILVGDDSDNSLAGLGGEDILSSAGGNDLLLGGDDADVLQAGAGSDIAFGDAGDDIVEGQAGDDIVSGGEGHDVVIGGEGNDTLMGVTGNDVLVGDSLSLSGGGSDIFVYGNDDGADTILDFEVGADQIGLVEGELTFADLTLSQDGGNTLLTVTSTDEVLAVLNNVDASALGEDSFVSVPDVSNLEEAIALRDAIDNIIGTDDDDALVGTDRDEFLDGQLGNDTYTGGGGADQFVFAIAQGIDTITDFEVGSDLIKLGGLTPEGVKFFELNDDTLVLTNSNELLGFVQGVTGLDSSVFV